MLDIISIGDTTTDMFLTIDEATVHCDLHEQNCQLCFSYADKVPVKSIKKISAVGNAANNAVGSSRLGLKAALYAIVGNDEEGKACIATFKKEKVKTTYIQVDKKLGTNYSTVLNFKGERTILVYHEHRTYKLPKLEKAKWVYFTSANAGSEKIHAELVKYLKKNGTKLAFNPGTFQLKMGKATLAPLLKMTDILFLNKEEAERLLEKPGTFSELAAELHGLGVKTVVITDGPKGSYCLHEGKEYVLPIYPAPVIERTGAGDSYGTAFVAAIVSGQSVPEAMRWGTMNSASVIGYIGAQQGLLTNKEMKARLKKAKEFQPNEVRAVETLAAAFAA